MKKLLGIVVLGLLLSGNAYAEKYPSGYVLYKDTEKIHIVRTGLPAAMQKVDQIAINHCGKDNYTYHIGQGIYIGKGKLLKKYIKKGYKFPKILYPTIAEYICSDKIYSVNPPNSFRPGKKLTSKWEPIQVSSQTTKIVSSSSTQKVEKKISSAYQDYIDKHFSNRRLDPIEGVWRINLQGDTSINIIYKSGNSYRRQALEEKQLRCRNIGKISKSGNTYFETGNSIKKNCKIETTVTMQYFNVTKSTADMQATAYGTKMNLDMDRVWPEDFSSHNAKFGGSTGDDSGLSFTIADKKNQCKAIGFKPATEKFADCVLKLVELDLKTQISNPTMVVQDTGTQQLANELKRNNNMQQSQFLMNLSNQLLNPSSPASSMSSSSCTVRGGTIKTINCW